MGKLQKISSQERMSIFESIVNDHEPIKDRDPEMKKNTPTSKQAEREARDIEKRAEWDNLTTASKLTHSNPTELDLVRSGRSVRSARCAPDGITNESGSGRFIGSSKNSVANAEFLDQVANMQTKREATAEEKRASADVRQMKQEEFKSAHSPRIGESEEAYFSAKGSNIASNHGQQGTKYTPGTGSISIFDDKDFERIQDKEMEVRTAKKDDSWKIPKKAESTSGANDKLIDNLTNQEDGSQYKSVQKESTDRLYEALLENMKGDKEN